ncbi:hypothetical protein [Halalkalibacter sp. APA_J-10(15)]|uniref:hypothetical protein n=1 Tax=Halalkalibacter sp. APA_J-10(15) TaxID=2933805 RepID=UPI001FF1CD19|nr:hypothetical protein [Halalkalibacter sp. APA_J-10(15)]
MAPLVARLAMRNPLIAHSLQGFQNRATATHITSKSLKKLKPNFFSGLESEWLERNGTNLWQLHIP